MEQLLIVEDDIGLNQGLCKALKADDRQIISCHDLKAAREQLLCGSVSLVLLDINLPDGSGLELLREVKENMPGVPVILLTANDTDLDIVDGLERGADDYITKPFGSEELLARIRTALRHSARVAAVTPQEQKYSREGLEIDFEKRLVTLNGKEIHLTQIEYKLVSLLAKNAGKVLTYDYILKDIWGPYADTDNQILRVNMANIRRKLEKNPAEPFYIFTEIGVGYRMKE